jgi:hypothetical protein
MIKATLSGKHANRHNDLTLFDISRASPVPPLVNGGFKNPHKSNGKQIVPIRQKAIDE